MKTETQFKIELKKVKEFRGMDGSGLNAELFVNGKKCALVLDEGRGGGCDYEVLDKELFTALQEHIKTLPLIKGESMDFPTNLDILIEEELERMDAEKLQKKIEKQMANKIMWGVPNGRAYAEVKFAKPLAEIPKDYLQKCVDKYKASFKEGEQFFNTNLQSLGIAV